MDSHAEFDALFSGAMDTVEALGGDSFATDFDWRRFDRIIDVGGSKGSKSIAILKQHPQLQALIVDRPQTIQGAEKYWADREDKALLARMNFQVGDLFNSLPAANSSRDIYFLCAVLHCFDDDQCVDGLKNIAHKCVDTGARIAVMDLVMEETGANLASTIFDMQMFMGTRGRERSLKEWSKIFKRSGLVLEEVVSLR